MTEARPSRFADRPALAARLLLALLLLLLSVYGAAIAGAKPGAAGPAVVDRTDTDLALYEAIAARVGSGESYYRAAVAEQRARKYPLKPAFTVRLPSLAWIVGGVGEEKAALLLKLLMLGAITGLALRLKSVASSRASWAAAAGLGACGMALLTVPAMTFWHESWAALLIIMSLAVRTGKLWIPSVLIGLMAVLIRELALPYLAVMALFAWRERNRTEAGGWILAMLVSVAAVFVHATILSGYVTGSDLASPGWSGAGGWPFVLQMMQLCSLFLFLPLGLIALLVPLSLLGWASLKHPLGERIAFLLFGYVAAFTLFGRPDNFYWGILIAPLLPVGLAFLPRALRDLGGSLEILNRGRSKVAG